MTGTAAVDRQPIPHEETRSGEGCGGLMFPAVFETPTVHHTVMWRRVDVCGTCNEWEPRGWTNNSGEEIVEEPLVACTNPTHDHTTTVDRAGMEVDEVHQPFAMRCNHCGLPTHYDTTNENYWHDDPEQICFLIPGPDDAARNPCTFGPRSEPLPCGHTVGSSVFERVAGGATLILNAAIAGDFGSVSATVWCTEGDGWVQIDEEQHTTLVHINAELAGGSDG